MTGQVVDFVAALGPLPASGTQRSDQTAEGHGAVSALLPFVSAEELSANAPLEPDWIWNSYLAAGGVTLLAAKPKAGKSTLAFALSEAVARAAPTFLGRPIVGGPVVYVSEEATGTLAHKLAALHSIRVLTRDAVWPKPPWHELVAGSVEEAKRVGAVLLVVDTWAYWAAMPRDAEKDAGAAQAAMQPLLDATREGLAVFVPLHQRKGGGDDGEAVRGSGAIAGAADIILELEKTQRPSERVLLALSRYPSTPGSLVIDYDRATGSWAVVAEGERTDARAMSDRLAILGALRDGEEPTRAELEQAIGAPERQWHAQLEALIEDGQAVRIGAGKKGDPYRFKLAEKAAQNDAAQKVRRNPETGSALSAAHPLRDAAEKHDRAEMPNGAQCAETDGTGRDYTAAIRAMAAILEADAERVWQRLEAEQREAS